MDVIRRGGADATMEEMASAGGISKPILYRHFTDREGLVAAITEHALGVLGRIIDEKLGEARPETGATRSEPRSPPSSSTSRAIPSCTGSSSSTTPGGRLADARVHRGIAAARRRGDRRRTRSRSASTRRRPRCGGGRSSGWCKASGTGGSWAPRPAVPTWSSRSPTWRGAASAAAQRRRPRRPYEPAAAPAKPSAK